MASSQVEIASSSPFGYVLNNNNNNNNNRCCGSRDSNNFQKNFKNLIQSHLHCSISNQEFGGNNNNENSKGADSSLLMPHPSCRILQKYTSSGESETHPPQTFSKSPSNVGEKWEKTRNMAFSMDKENQESLGGGGGVSSLVRKWKDFESESKSLNLGGGLSCADSSSLLMPHPCQNLQKYTSSGESETHPPTFSKSPSNIGGGNNESCLLVGSPQKGYQECESDWESDKTTDMSKEPDDDVKESERLGVADIIKKLKFDSGGGSLPRVRTTTTRDHSEQQRCNFSPVLSSPRFIRGRQAFSDLLLQMERDRQRELDGLLERKAVSRFQQRGRIQALLRFRLIRRDAEVKAGQSVNFSAPESNKSTHSSAIMHLREKFNTVGQHGFAVSRNTSKVVAKSIHESGSLPSTPKRQQKENGYLDFKGLRSPQRELARSNSAKEGTGFSLYQQKEKDPLKGLVEERSELHPGVAESISTSIELGDNTRDPVIFGKESRLKPTSPHKEVVDNKSKVGSVVESNLLQEENHHEQVPDKFSSRQQREGDRHHELDRERSGTQPGVEDSRSTPTALGEIAYTSKEESHHKPRNSHNEVVDSIPKVGVFCISNQLQEENNHYEELCKKLSSRKVSISTEVTNLSENQKNMDLNHQEINTSSLSCTSQVPSLDNISEKDSWANTSSEASHSNLLDFVESGRTPKARGANKQLPWTCNEWFSDCPNRQSDREEEETNKCLVESDSGSVSAYSLTASGWDELQSNYQQDDEGWISSVSRPRKEWEGLRQERYQEMLDPFSNNHDIRQLLHRKSVSMFLTSSLREDIDRIMASRSQQLPKATSSHVEEEVSAQVAEDKEEVEQNAREEEDEVGEEEEWDYDDDSEDDNSPCRQQYKEPEVLIHQNISLQTLRSWNTNPDQEVTDDSYHFPSPSSLQSQPRSSSSGHPSTEMELIYEMRGHMEKLHHEIFEIRRSMKSCINMQMKLQRSFKKDVAAAISQLGQKSRGNSDNKGSNKQNCCVCHEEPVDSLLYRCGHMCTCFKCAHELISGTGKCPICQSPIMDVVRAHAHS